MSAFIVGSDHIDLLVSFAVAEQLDWFTSDPRAAAKDAVNFEDYARRLNGIKMMASKVNADAVGALLLSTNIESVGYRYEHSEIDGLPGAQYQRGYRARLLAPDQLPAAIVGLKAIDCYEYQSCEHPGWQDSPAQRFCDALRGALVRSLPGYDRAPWEWSRPTMADSPSGIRWGAVGA